MGLIDDQSATRPKRLPRDVRERQILDAAVRVFSEYGYHATSMDEVSSSAGISKPMIYAYLGSKEDLFAACIRRETDRILQAILRSLPADAPADVQLWRGLQAFFGFIGDNHASWRVLHKQASVQGGPFAQEQADLRARAIQLLAALLVSIAESSEHTEVGETAKRSGQSLAAALVGAGESLADWWLDNPEETAEHLAQRMMNLLWAGFGNLMAGRTWSPADATR